jgi:hypothetical protein
MTAFTREDFEHAARAAGYCIHDRASDGAFWVFEHGAWPNEDGECPIFKWCPPDDDGDALRLSVKLNFNVCKREHEVEVFNDNNGEFLCSISISEGDDPYAATRTAIFRAAIAIGKAMLAPDTRPTAESPVAAPGETTPEHQTPTLFSTKQP